MDFEAFLFDMDGTLVDSDAAVERSWTAWAHENGLNAADVLAVAHGSPAEATVRRLLPGLEDAAVAEAAAWLLAMEYDDVADLTPTPGALDLLAALDLAGLPWAVVTSADAKLAKIRLEAVGIAPAVLITRDDVAKGKPDPEGYLLAACRLAVAPSRCLVVEDTEVGAAAGRAAGAKTATLKGVHGDFALGTPRDLLRLLSP